MGVWRGFLSVVAVCAIAGLGPTAAADTRSTPRLIIYYNADVTPADAIVGTGYTHVILSFLTLNAAADDPTDLVVPGSLAQPLAAVPRLKADGKRVLISFGGGDMTEQAWRVAVGREAALAAALAGFVAKHDLDGVDIDFEITPALEQNSQTRPFDGVKLLINLTRALRAALPNGVTISHAPQPPYLSPDWHGGPYLSVLRNAGEAIDWISVQYYNNPGFQTPAAGQVVGLGAGRAPTSVAGLAGGDVGITWPVEKIVVGKPVYKADAATGHLAPADVVSKIVEPLMRRYGGKFGGLMGWQFSNLTADHRYWNTRIAPVLISR